MYKLQNITINNVKKVYKSANHLEVSSFKKLFYTLELNPFKFFKILPF